MNRVENPLQITCETTGFSSPAETYVENRLNPNDLIMPNPLYTFFLRACGNMEGVSDGDVLVIDRSLDPVPGDKVVVFESERFELKRYSGQKDVWGVVTFSIRPHRK